MQQAFRDYIKEQLNIDLDAARDPEFDKRSYFNVDIREVVRIGSNATNYLSDANANPYFREIRNHIAQYRNLFDVRIEQNGAYRFAFFVNKGALTK